MPGYLTLWKNHEAHFSAVRGPAQTYTRVSGPHAYARRQSSDSRAACKRAGTPWRLRRAERYRKAQRLRGDTIAEILAVTRPGRAGSLSAQVKPNGLKYARLGLVVPKRFLARAVDRNRAKRIFREWFRRNQRLLIGRDLLVRLRARPSSQLESLMADLERALVSER